VLIELKRDSHVPLYDQIAGQVRGMITGGTLKIGDRLPANRELARILGVNRTTVTTAYAELMADGLINSHVGRGTFICGMPAAANPASRKEQPRPAAIQWGALLTEPEARQMAERASAIAGQGVHLPRLFVAGLGRVSAG